MFFESGLGPSHVTLLFCETNFISFSVRELEVKITKRKDPLALYTVHPNLRQVDKWYRRDPTAQQRSYVHFPEPITE